jgi:hypothetical protein
MHPLQMKVLRVFLSLNLCHVTGPVNQYGASDKTSRQAREEKRKAKLERQKMTRKQRRVSDERFYTLMI